MQASSANIKLTLIKTLGDIIRKHRVSQNKTIYKISAESSMSKSTWREVELGVCNDINFTTLWKIAEGLGEPLSNIIEELQETLDDSFTLID